VVIATVASEAPVSGGYNGGAVSAGRNFASSSFSSGSSGSGLNEYVDEALLARVAAVIESDGDGTATNQDNDGAQYVDDSLFARIASSLSGSESGSQRNTQYGAPSQSGGASLGQPEPARRYSTTTFLFSNGSRSNSAKSMSTSVISL
jgi:hypothetical protein